LWPFLSVLPVFEVAVWAFCDMLPDWLAGILAFYDMLPPWDALGLAFCDMLPLKVELLSHLLKRWVEYCQAKVIIP